MKRALVTDLPRSCPECGEDSFHEPYFVSGLVSPSADGSEWEVELVGVVFGGKHLTVADLSEAEQERAKDRLADMAQRAEQEIAFGG